jgi:uncharacterized protein YecE (DUF72 family)
MDEKRPRLGTSSWSNDDWKAAGFYPAEMESRDYLAHYARRYDTVEVDSTFYRSPPAAMVARWASVTPAEFRFSLKVPGEITHEKALADCGKEWDLFLSSASLLGEKLRFLLLQFGYFNKSSACPTLGEFLKRLGAFLDGAKPPCTLVVEVRNRPWVGKDLLAFLRERRALFAITDQEWMPRPRELWEKHRDDLLGGEAAYIRFLGERKRIEAITKTWEKTVIDRSAQMCEVLPIVAGFLERDIPVWAYFNNHYSGHAPASVELFRRLWEESR